MDISICFFLELAKNNFMEYNSNLIWDVSQKWYDASLAITMWTFQSENFQKFLKTKQHFDVVIVESCLQDALYGASLHFNAPLIVTSAFHSSKYTTDLVGVEHFASYVPHLFNHYSDHMTFWQRMYNSFSYWYEEIVLPLYYLPIQQKIMEENFPNTKHWPSLADIKRNVSIVLLNTHVTYGTARPYPPNMIEVGGMQIKKKLKLLPPDIQHFLDGAENGVIYVSFGSNLQLSKMPPSLKHAIVNAFSDYPNTRILLKSDDDVTIPSHKTSNVLVEKWFDQHAVLAHKNLRLFVTHGGLLSTTGMKMKIQKYKSEQIKRCE